jgi:phage terminase large subunit-like protein
MSVYCDEEPPKDFYDEQLPRLLAEDGDFLLGLTPANGLSWTFDDIFEKAQVYFRTEKVVEFLNETDKSRKVGVV